MRTRRRAKYSYDLRARIAYVQARFAAEGKPVPGVNAVVKWLLKRGRERA